LRILGLEKLSLVDYEGYTAAVVFTGGCNFLCPFCHNSGLVYNSVTEIPEKEVLGYLDKRFGLLDAVCISGGEPTIQPDLKDFITKVKNIGYKVKLDTNGTNPAVLQDLIDSKLIDYVAMDIKNSEEGYCMTTGLKSVEFDKISHSIEILKSGKVDYEFRTTIVKEFHNQNNIVAIGNLLKGAKILYLQKFVNNDNCINQSLTSVDKETAEKYREILNKSIKEVKLRGYV